MGILKEMEKFLEEEIIKTETPEVETAEKGIEEEDKLTGFTMEPEGDGYKIELKGKEICTVEFVNNDTDKSDDLEDAQNKPEDYTVYIKDVKDKNLADEYAKKLDDMGFERVSV